MFAVCVMLVFLIHGISQSSKTSSYLASDRKVFCHRVKRVSGTL